MTPEAALDRINAAEQAAPVDEWRVGGAHVWPLVRERAWWRLLADDRRGAAPRPSVLARVAAAAGGLALPLLDRAGEDRLRHTGGVLFVGDNVSRIVVGDRWYDRFCEPVMELLAERGVASHLLEPHHRHPRPRSAPSRHVQLALDATRLRGAHSAARHPADLPGLDAVAGLLGDVLDLSVVPRWGSVLLAQAAVFERHLDATGARLGVYVDLNHQTMAFTLACHRRGLPCVELQHGVQDEAHWVGARWSRVPAAGYDVLPDRWWVWTVRDAEVVERWAGTDGPHGAVVGGHPWLERWRRGGAEVEAATAAVRAAFGRTVAHHAVVTLQPRLVSTVLDALDADPRVRWWVRAHPLLADDERATMHAWVGRRADAAVAADEVPLYAWLAAADVHVTHSSAAAFEAAILGSPSVALHEEGCRVHPALTADGWVRPASAAATAAVLAARVPTVPVVTEGSSAAAVDELLVMAAGRGGG